MANIRAFILNITENCTNSKNLLSLSDKAESTLLDFIHNPHTLVLQCVVTDSNLALYTEIQSSQKSIVFFKTKPKELVDVDAVKDVNFLSFSENAIESLYQMLKQIYSPLLAKGSDLFSTTLQKNIVDLESNLKILAHGDSKNNVNVIISVEDELEYWKLLEQNNKTTRKEKEAASTFSDLFQDICEEIRSMQSSAMVDVRESAENIGGLLDEVWRYTPYPYPQDRIIHILNVVGHNICTVIQKQITTYDLWKVTNSVKDNEILKLLLESVNAIQTWTSACCSLTETYWPNYALHMWNGKPYVPPFCENFQKRIKEIYEIRSTHTQLEKLLSQNERMELKTDQVFQAFEGVNIWIYNAPNKAWDTALSRFMGSLRPAETKIAEKLKSRLHNTATKQMLYEFVRYKTLIQRPLVKQALNHELQIFITSLLAMVKEIQEQLDSDDIDVKMFQPAEMSPLVHQIQWMKLMEAKVKDIQNIADSYLKDFDGSAELVKLSSKLLKDLRTMYTQLYDGWCREVQGLLKSSSLLSPDKPVVSFSGANRLLVVNVSSAAWQAAAAARALRAAGFSAPPPADLGNTKLACARALHQVASFHNTLGERMIPSTRPMMLQAALDLANAVQDPKAVYWDDEDQLVQFTEKLKKVVMKLESQNTFLTSQHVAIRNIVAKLMETDLLAKHSEWKKGINEIRDIIEKVESNGYKNTELWRTHWDAQLYRALECQYIKTILSLHKHFPSYRVDLVIRGHQVRFQPPMEEVRVHHYQLLRRVVSLPTHFVGLTASLDDAKSVFASIVDKHGGLGNRAVHQLESTLSQLARRAASWARRAALATVPDLEDLCRRELTTPEHWELNFKACKAYGQAVAKMPFEDEKLEWITITTATLRREFEAQTRNLWSCLLSSLQTNCRNDVNDVDAFIASAAIMLDNKALPKNAKELAEVSAKQQALAMKMPEMEKTVELLRRKSHLLRTWGGDPAVEGTLQDWNKTREMMLGQQKMFEHQAEIVKSSLTGEWQNLNTSVEAWLSRWVQNRAKFESTHDASYEDMVDRCRSVFEAKDQWDKFVADRDELLKECQKFSMPPLAGAVWPEAEALIAECVTLWSPLKLFHEEQETLAEQQWLVFQKKLHLLDELVGRWSERLEPYTCVTVFIQKQLDQYAELPTQLKYLRCPDFTEKHWREVFSLLQLPTRSADSLLLRHLLQAAENIQKHVLDLQKLSASATSEAAVRAALDELELWFAGARLVLVYHTDSTGQQTPVVKDYKEITAKIEEQQWLAARCEAAAWEARLRSALSLAQKAARAQLRIQTTNTLKRHPLTRDPAIALLNHIRGK